MPVLGLSEIVKCFGVPRKWLPVFVIGRGVTIVMSDAYRLGIPDFIAEILGIVVGATVTGLYTAGKGFVVSTLK